MRYAVTFSQDNPDFAGSPVNWPISRRPLADNEQAAHPEVEMTDGEFDAYVSEHDQERAAFAAWREALVSAQEAITVARSEKSAALGATLHADLLAVFQSWTPAEQYEFDGARRALADDLAAGNLAKVIDAVTNFRSGDTTVATHRAAILAVLNPAAAKLAALAAATTIEQINTIF